MKKTIFDLSNEEGKKLEKELKKTPYGKQYNTVVCIGCICSFFLVIMDVITGFVDNNMTISEMLFDIGVLIFTLHMFISFKLKWLDLIKKYYDETK